MKVEGTLITIKCSKCGTDRAVSLSDIIDAANLPSGETRLVHTISEPCEGCDGRIEVELELELEEAAA